MRSTKHIHHYVPRRYLCAWSDDGRTIAVRFGDGIARRMAIGSIAFEDGGYSYVQLTPEMLRSILCCKPRSHLITDFEMRGFFLPTVVIPVYYRTLVEPSNRDVIAMWEMIKSAHLIDETGCAKLENFRRLFTVAPGQVEKAIRAHQKEGYEDMFRIIENNAWPILDSMIEGDVGWVADDKLAFRMFYYICSQRTRSPGFKKMLYSTYAPMGISEDFADGGLYRRYILAFDSAAILMSYRQKLTFRILRADGCFKFITGDLPVVSVWGEEGSDYYFPLSPNRALLFGLREKFDKRNDVLVRENEESIRMLNRAIMRDAALQVYGLSEQILNEL